MTETKRGFFARLREGLTKTRSSLIENVKKVFSARTTIDDDVYDELEQILIEADLGVDTSLKLIEDMKRLAKERRIETPDALYDLLKEELTGALLPGDHTWVHAAVKPCVTLVVGVNGSGKTTTTGKLAAKLKAEGRSVMLGAADTFRAAAVEQLTIWSERASVPIVKHQDGADPAAVAYDATDAAIARGIDHLLIDTAGRLHTKVNLMEELRKVHRVIAKRMPDAPHEILLVLDATTGQNGLQQARIFTESIPVNGIVLTKLDGTAKGGIVIAIQRELGIPIKFVGVGEGIDDLQPFNPREFVDALFS